MAIVNFQEKLLFYTKRKSVINKNISDIQSQIMAVTRKEADNQAAYNKKCQEAYYDPEFGYGTDEYVQVQRALAAQREWDQSGLLAWEVNLELEKDSLEAQLAEIQSFEQSWQNLLKQNISKDFAYGGAGGK